MNQIIKLFILSALFFSFLYGCKKKEEVPVNPYDSVDYGSSSTAETSLDPNTLQGIHKNI